MCVCVCARQTAGYLKLDRHAGRKAERPAAETERGIYTKDKSKPAYKQLNMYVERYLQIQRQREGERERERERKRLGG